jgi:hypothetical protein
MVVYVAGYPAIMGLQPLTSEIPSSPGGTAIPGEAKKTKNADARAAGTPKENKAIVKGSIASFGAHSVSGTDKLQASAKPMAGFSQELADRHRPPIRLM